MSILDKTYIAIYISGTDKKLYKNWERYLLQNILITFNFDIKFTYKLVR